jgi:hypothetical protein
MTFPIQGSAPAAAISNGRPKVPAARKAIPVVKAAPAAPGVGAAQRDTWADVKTVLDVGLAIVRIVEIAILFA